MYRCFAPPERWLGTEVILSREETHHLLHVLRARRGDLVGVFDGAGRLARARVDGVKGTGSHGRAAGCEELVLTIIEEQRAPARSLLITLIQALPKSTKMDFIVEKATELGAAQIIPVECERVVPHRRPGQIEARLGRWRRIVIQAARQCGSSWLPEVCAPVSFSQVVERCHEFDLCLLGSLHEGAAPARTVLERLGQTRPRTVALMIGPEGDFSPEEVAQAVAAGAHPVRFGPLVLRVETAAIFGLAVIAYEFL